MQGTKLIKIIGFHLIFSLTTFLILKTLTPTLIIPFHYLTRTETEMEDNILLPSPETFGNNTPIDENIETTNEGKILL